MYSLRPYHQFSSEIVPPTCMYQLKKICEVEVLQDSAVATPIKEEKLEELLGRQNVLLGKLKVLQDDVACQLSQQATNMGCIRELVISMDPSHPSSSILLTQSILSSIHPILISSFTHSSVGCADKVKERITPSTNSHDRNRFKFGITYIWKKAPSLPSLLLHPSNQMPILGESNIIKFLFTLITGNHVNKCVVMTTILDDLIDAIDSYRTFGSPTLESILENLEKTISSTSQPQSPSPWLFGGEEVGAGDVMLWGVLKSSNKSSKNLPKNIQGWFEGCGRKFGGLSVAGK